MSNLISIGKVIDVTWDHYIKHFKVLMRISLWLFAVSAVTILFVIISPGFDTTGDTLAAPIGWTLAQAVAVFLTSVIVGSWVFMTTALAAKNQSTGKKVDTKELGKTSWRLLLSYIWIILLKIVVNVLPVLVIVPGFALLVWNTGGAQNPWLSAVGTLLTVLGVVAALLLVIWIEIHVHFSEYKLVFEEIRGLKALKASWGMVKGRFWKTLWRTMIPKLVFLIPIIVLQFVLAIGVSLILSPASVALSDINLVIKISQVADNLLGAAIAVLTTPIYIIVDYYVYDSLRKAK